MKIATTLFIFVVVGCTWRETLGTCVFQSDFGFVLNCAFKKSGLFRVRNLGGVKGYVGLGFSVGDELGFAQSLSNLEANKRRSVQTGRGGVPSYTNTATNRDEVRQHAQNTRQVVPPFKPLPPGAARPIAQQPERQKLVVQQNSTVLRTVPAPSLSGTQQDLVRQQQLIQQEAKQKQQLKLQQEAFALQVLKQQRLQQQEAMRQQQLQKLQQQQQKQQQMVVQQQKRHQQIVPMQVKRDQTPQMIAVAASIPGKLPNIVAAIPPVGSIIEPDPSSKSGSPSDSLPPFISMPQSLSQLTDRISNSPVILEDSDNEVSKDDFNQLPLPGDEVASSVNEMTLLSLHPMSAEPSQSQQQTEKRQSLPSSLPSLAPIQGMETSLKALAEASNITLEALEAAILLRQQQLLRKQQGPTSTSTTTTTTMSPHKNKYNPGATKVMNAPREYYPMGYDKNFDDNFASRVDLPDTSFYCGDQKHFPGLYADEDLGCMVFHVCALTDDGLIMKSFLCPESTLFDQTILKCNWWFYVDCKASKSLYDSNIPISKSYQLMKALAFFSAYKNHDNSTTAQENSETLE
ncbi:PREDICTED: mediator of RNA polymerase II transcription subunit 15-like [Eufriesea mexicana]|uniref:mediator of RNA polymerase II transcription subunit 15-like n=1 Tax=Eufriesea mexicana TaxID=516756 RepID=UPI00083C1D20|nr:PREDICTED: mediator of RNA polymerase II transcription subunit 15-like [Eufriesea mexicana]